MNKVISYLLILLLIVTSYQSIFVEVSFLDEFILVAIILAFIINCFITKEKLLKKTLLNKAIIFTLLLYIGSTLITLCINQYETSAYLAEIFNNIKPLIILLLFVNLQISQEDIKKLMNSFLIINIPSLIFLLIDFIRFYILNIRFYQGFQQRYGLIRLEGLSGHPIQMGYILMLIIVWIHYNYKRTNISRLILCLLVIMQFLTFARLPFVFTLGYFAFYYCKAINSKLIKAMGVCIAAIVTTILITILINNFFNVGLNYFENEAENTIRLYSLSKAGEIIKDNGFFGVGIGRFGDRASVLYNSDIYYKYSFRTDMIKFAFDKPGSMFESHLAKQIIETGIIGTLLFYGVFLILIINSKGSSGKKNPIFLLKYLTLVILLNSIFNPIYTIPLYLITCLLSSTEDNQTSYIKSRKDTNLSYVF